MAHRDGSRVWDYTSGAYSSTGNVTFAGTPPTGYQSPNTLCTADGDTIDLVLFGTVAGVTQWSYERFTRVSAGVFSRTGTPWESSSGANISFTSGVKECMGDKGAPFAEHLNTVPITVASAATMDVGAVRGVRVDSSGTTGPVTSLGTSKNKLRIVKWSGQTITAGSGIVLLDVPSGSNRKTVAGDMSILMSDASGNWYEIAFQELSYRSTPHGDTDYTILATDRFVSTSAALAAARTWTLPAASSVRAGTELVISDVAGAITSTNTLIVARAGSDTINGGTSSITLVRAYASIRLRSDGSAKWTIVSCNGAHRFTAYLSGTGTHITLPGCTEMDVEGCGGGGGGASTGTGPGAATAGGNTTFGSLTGNGGGAGTNSLAAFIAGGTASGGDVNITGTGNYANNGSVVPGITGACSPLGGGGAGGPSGTGSGVTAGGYGAGGGSGGTTGVGVSNACGGAAGGYFRKKFLNPAATYSYAIGAAGTTGAAGVSGASGGNGSPGVNFVWERVT